jgi:endonuclease-3
MTGPAGRDGKAKTAKPRVRKVAAASTSTRKTVRASSGQANVAAKRATQSTAEKRLAKKASPARTSTPKKRATAKSAARMPAAKPARRQPGGTALRRPARRMSPAEIDALFQRLSDANPAPTTELEFSTPYELLVAVALSAQATDVSVNRVTRRLFPVANTPQAIAALGVDGLAPDIATINFNRTKARNVVAMAGQLLEHHGGEVPLDRASLEALAGVGRKTANVVLNTAFGETTLAVDTHIFRVANRTGLAPGRDVRAVEDELMRVVPAAYLRHAHHWLLLHGRYVCKARLPDCPRCIVRDLCHYRDKTPGDAPPLEAAPAPTRRAR